MTTTYDTIWNKNFILLCLANLSMFMSIHMLFPTLPLYLSEIGGKQSDVGYIMAAFTLGSMLMRIFAGWLVDRFGRKKNLLIGITMMLIISLLYGLPNSVVLLSILRILHGLAFGLTSTAFGTMAADSLPLNRLGEGIGYFGLTTTLSMSLAPLLGLSLIGGFGYKTLFLALGALSLLAFFNSLLVKNTHAPHSESAVSFDISLANLLEKTALFPSYIAFFLALIYGATLYFVALYAAGLGINSIGFFFTVIALTMFIFRPISGRLADRGKETVIIYASLAVILISTIIMSSLRTGFGFLVAGVLYGVGFSFSLPTLQAMALRHAPAHRRGAATGTYFVAFDLGLGLGAILWGFVAEAGSFRLMYFSTIIPLLIAAAIYFRYKKKYNIG